MKNMRGLYFSMLLAGFLFFGSTHVLAAQTGWLLRTASAIAAEEVDESNSAPYYSNVHIWDATAGAYTTVSRVTRSGWAPLGVVIDAGEQFVFEWADGGNDEYLDWSYAYIGDWRITAPDDAPVSGDVSIEWSAFNISSNPTNLPPNYAAWVKVMDGTTLVEDLGLIWETESVVWLSQAVPSGNYTIDIKIVDSTVAGGEGMTVAEITKEITLENSGVVALATSTMEMAVEAAEGNSPASGTFEVWGTDSLSYSISDDVSWLSCSPASGTSDGEHDSIAIDFSSAGLAVGSYTGLISVVSAEASNSPKTIEVILDVVPVALTLSVSEIKESVIDGGSPADRMFEVWGNGALSYTVSDNVSWLLCSPESGSSSGEHDAIAVSFASDELSVGSYTGAISVASAEASNSPQQIEVVLEVEGGVQTGWLLRTASTIGVEEIGGNTTPTLSTAHVWDATEGTYYSSSKTRSGWVPGDFVVFAGEQFVFEMPGGGDGYLGWPYAYVGDWRLTAPVNPSVSGDVPIEWGALQRSNITTNPAPGYAARVKVTGDNYMTDLGLIWAGESVVWHSYAAPNGSYSIDVSIVDSPFNGAEGMEVATLAKQINLDNSGITAIALSTFDLFAVTTIGHSPVDQTFEVWGTGPVTYSVSDNLPWLSCSPTSGSSSGEHDTITVSFASEGLSVGSYTGQISVASAEASNSSQTIDVILEVEPIALVLSDSEMNESIAEGGSVANDRFEVWGTGSLAYSVSENVSWLSCFPTNGLSSGEHDSIAVSFASSGLPEGSYTGLISIVSADAANSPEQVRVVLDVESTTVSGTQMGWMLRTATATTVEEINGNNTPFGSVVHVWDASTVAYTTTAKSSRGGWTPSGVVIEAGKQFVFEWYGGGNDEYLGWPYAYVGDWRMTSPIGGLVTGDVPIEWSVFNVSNISGNPSPNYAARVTVSGDDVAYDEDFGLVWPAESVMWHSQEAPSGSYTIEIKIVDSPAEGLEGVEVASITKHVYHIATPIDGQRTETIDHATLAVYPDDLYVGSNTTENAMVVLNGGVVQCDNGFIGFEASSLSNMVVVIGADSEWSVSGGLYVGGNASAAGGTGNSVDVSQGGTLSAASVTVYAGNVLHLADGGTLMVAGDFNAAQGGFDHAGGTLEIGGSLVGMSELPSGNRLEVAEVVGDLAVYGTFSPGSPSGAAPLLRQDVGTLAESGSGAVMNGTLTLEAGGSLEMEIGGYEVGTGYDHLVIAGSASLEGSLNVVFVDGFMPVGNDTFVLFDWDGGVTGNFTSVNLPAIPFGLLWNTSELYSSGIIRVELSMLDSDADSIKDEWEYLRFGGDVSPFGNPDFDQHNNLDEYIAGTDPTDPGSLFSLVSRQLSPAGFVLEWPSVSNRLYSVLWADSLTNGFQTLETGIEFPQGSYTDAVNAVGVEGFYRVDVQLK